MSFNKITVIGLGYIGLPTAGMFASMKKNVIGVDIKKSIVDTINRGEIHLVEPDLEKIIHEAVISGHLRATNKPEESDAFLIAVPTPLIKNGNNIPKPDMKYVESAIHSVAPVLKKGDLIVLESTSPVGTTNKIAELLETIRPDLSFPNSFGDDADVNIAYCPERVLPGQVIRELTENDRVIGGISSACSQKAKSLYSLFVKGECISTDSKTAEMVKLAENSCRDNQIAFANELSIICDELDINVWELIALANRHPRINILNPGPGVGGHCIAVDPWFIVSRSPKESKIIKTARIINDAKPDWVIKKVKQKVREILKTNPQKTVNDISIVCFGLSFKPNIDDFRESPALAIAEKISAFHTGNFFVVEPNLKDKDQIAFNKISIEEACDKADIALMLVNHNEFQSLSIRTKYIIDTCGVWGNLC